MKKLLVILILISFCSYSFAQDELNEIDETLKNLKKELNYLKKRNSDLRVQIQKVKKELTTFKEMQKDNMDNMNNTLLQLSTNIEANKELVEVVKLEQEKINANVETMFKNVGLKICIIFSLLVIVLVIAILLPIKISKRNRKELSALSEGMDTKFKNLEGEIKKTVKSLNDKIDLLQKPK